MVLKLSTKDLASVFVIEAESAGCHALVGSKIRIDIQQVNPMIRRAVIVPTGGSPGEEKFMGIFGKIRPSVVSIEGDMLLCSLGIMARRSA